MNIHFCEKMFYISFKKAFMRNITSISLMCVLNKQKFTKHYLQLHYTAAGW